MGTEGSWRLLLNERKGKNSRLIFTGRKNRSLIDITVDSQQAEEIIPTVLNSNWNSEQLITFLNRESEKIFQEAL
ncbi:MAG: hypothetical protein P4N41_17220 [Negativicutes bacterium]|nr:hypothetical protein [Negativicutes bacterium]